MIGVIRIDFYIVVHNCPNVARARHSSGNIVEINSLDFILAKNVIFSAQEDLR